MCYIKLEDENGSQKTNITKENRFGEILGMVNRFHLALVSSPEHGWLSRSGEPKLRS